MNKNPKLGLQVRPEVKNTATKVGHIKDTVLQTCIMHG